jgi:hypothetical protein
MNNDEAKKPAQMPEQTQNKPGLESKMNPRPKFQAPAYRGADKLKGQVALVTGGDSYSLPPTPTPATSPVKSLRF